MSWSIRLWTLRDRRWRSSVLAAGSVRQSAYHLLFQVLWSPVDQAGALYAVLLTLKAARDRQRARLPLARQKRQEKCNKQKNHGILGPCILRSCSKFDFGTSFMSDSLLDFLSSCFWDDVNLQCDVSRTYCWVHLIAPGTTSLPRHLRAVRSYLLDRVRLETNAAALFHYTHLDTVFTLLPPFKTSSPWSTTRHSISRVNQVGYTRRHAQEMISNLHLSYVNDNEPQSMTSDIDPFATLLFPQEALTILQGTAYYRSLSVNILNHNERQRRLAHHLSNSHRWRRGFHVLFSIQLSQEGCFVPPRSNFLISSTLRRAA